MSVIPAGFGSAAGDFTIDNSLRFRQAAGAYLTRSQSAGNQTTWTWSAWVKLGYLNNDQWLFGGYNATNNFTGITINLNSGIQIYQKNTNNTLYLVREAPIRRDYSSWYHFIIAYDSTQATSTDRIRFYVNGEQITTFASATWPDLNRNTWLNYNAASANIGRGLTTGNGQFDGYQTEINFIDGQALTADDFGEFDEDTGVWKPKAYSGSYGTNGFRLNGSSLDDSSGNNNDFTNNNLNLSTSSASTYDLMNDVPTLTDEDNANFATWNPLFGGAVGTLSEGNLKYTSSGGTYNNNISTQVIGPGMKIYWEVTAPASWINNSQFSGGIAEVADVASKVLYPNTNYSSAKWSGFHTTFSYANGSQQGSGLTGLSLNQIVSFAYDYDAGTLDIWFDNVLVRQITGINNGTDNLKYVFMQQGASIIGPGINFGQRPFAYTPPTGFKKLNTYNLPDSTIVDGSEHFNTVLYTGDGTTGGRDITGVGFQPDFTWIKDRSAANYHSLHDAVRGSGQALQTNTTSAELSYSDYFGPFISDGFTIASVLSGSNYNASGNAYASWNWKANGSGVSNTDGSITSTVSANTTAGFSIVTYTGTGATSSGVTIGHGLGATPELIITKCRDTPVVAGGDYWSTWHKDLGGNYGIWLNLTSGRNSGMWDGYANISSTVFVPPDLNYGNSTNKRYVNYVFAGVEGFSKFGSYTGNGSTDGPFIYTGFRPAWVMIRRTDTTDNWNIQDSARTPYNWTCNSLFANLSNAESTAELESTYGRDYLSNGFKLRASHTSHNASGGNYIYAAFAENPFKNALAR